LLNILSCQSQPKPNGEPAATAPAEKPGAIELAGVNTQDLTTREKEQWSSYVTELLAPCSDQPVSIAQCVTEKRKCEECLPSAQFLLRQVTAGKSREQAEAAYRLRFAAESVKPIELGDSPSKGDADAAVTVVEWADFQCPYCSMAAPIVGSLVKRYPGQVRVLFKHYPLPGHEHSEKAARAANAAGKQGKFWEMHDLLFVKQSEISEKGIEGFAKELGLDMKQFAEDWRSEAVADAVAADRKQAEKLGLRGTPSIFINGRSFSLEQFELTEELDPWVQLEIQLRTGKPGVPSAITPKPMKATEAAATSAPAPAGG
jgi:protein-disulfide isomerase